MSLLELLRYICEMSGTDRQFTSPPNDGQELPMMFDNNRMTFCEVTPGHPFWIFVGRSNLCSADRLDCCVAVRPLQSNLRMI